ncbi:27 kDa hemolymph protein-like [Odontomachus brunneus]|uniref:27 kDa hemolymph protein-like n=1 Tax=Odontomachus brunneus TaxID=486640 RepID=UPI0013F26B48|nr:27 kDa hemolymph protein-like [Odontomachus brunneus]
MKHTTFTAVVLLLGFLGHTHSQEFGENLSVPDEKLREMIPELANVDTSALPSVEEAKNLFKEKCTRNGGADAFDNVHDAQVKVEQCLKSLINVTELQAEMELHKPNGDLDLVFKKYCNKRSILRACVSNFTEVLEQCLDEKERENKKIVMNITDSMLEFICFKEGDRIALFIAAGGPECFQAKQQAVQDCANKTLSGYIPKSDPSGLIGLESLPRLNFESKECTDMNNLQACVVKELETCTDPTPANIVDSIFNFVKKVTPCENILNAQSAAATADGTSGAPRVSGAFTVALVILSAIVSCSKQNFFGMIA